MHFYGMVYKTSVEGDVYKILILLHYYKCMLRHMKHLHRPPVVHGEVKGIFSAGKILRHCIFKGKNDNRLKVYAINNV